MHDSHSGFEAVTRLDGAREHLLDLVSPPERTELVPIVEASGRALAAPVSATRAVPHYDRAAMDGYAVRAADTQRSGRSPATLAIETERVDSGTAAHVHTGSPLPEGADAVVMVEDTRQVDGALEVATTVAEGENVAPVGEDVADGQHLYDAGERLGPADLALLRAVGHEHVEVAARTRVSVIPTGEELVAPDAEPEPGEVLETNGLMVAQLVERWGGEATYRDVVTDEAEALESAIDRDLDHDLIVTLGGTSVGERDLLPGVLGERGSVEIHGLAIKPGHPAGFGVVDDTPVLLLPGYPVSCLVVATQLLRPAMGVSGGYTPDPLPTTSATLDRKIPSEPGVRTFARVTVEDGRVEPVRTSGAGVLSSAALSDGWVVVPEESEGHEAGTEVAVERWDWWP